MPMLMTASSVPAEPEPMRSKQLAPSVQQNFRKTRMCNAITDGRCSLGASCRFAHSPDELVAAPDLTKTRLCFNYFRQQCNDPCCRFAHGYEELRGTETLYKTGLCHGWASGSCRFGASCRFAHGVEELRTSAIPGGTPGAGVDA